MSMLKKIFPYCCLGLTAFLPSYSSTRSDATACNSESFNQKHTASAVIMAEYDIAKKQQIEYKTQALMNTYIDNAISGIVRITHNKQKQGYVKSVLSELPGAPHGKRRGKLLHCLYGQYTQLNRALYQLHDTIQIIPTTDNAHKSCSSFKQQMSQLYDNPEYSGAIYEGHLFTDEKEYDSALDKYLQSNMDGKLVDNPDSLRMQYTKIFEQNNFCANVLNPGSIIIVNTGHAVMYLGQGRIRDGQFIPDANGTAICCAYNSEHSVVSLSTWKTTKAFAADIQNIAKKRYEQEFEQSNPMSYTNLVKNRQR